MRLRHLKIVIYWIKHKLTPCGRPVGKWLKLLLISILRPIWLASPISILLNTIVPTYGAIGHWLSCSTSINHLDLLTDLLLSHKNSVFSSFRSQTPV